MSKIRKLQARQIFDSQANPTVEVELITDTGLFRASVPNDIRDNPFGNKSLQDHAVNIVNAIIAPALINEKLKVKRQHEIDQFLNKMDGSEYKTILGSAATYAVSAACCKAGATYAGLPIYQYIAKLVNNRSISIPVPGFSIIGGGRKASNRLIFHDYGILPIGAENFAEAFDMGIKVYRAVEERLAYLDGVHTPLTTNEAGAFVPRSTENDADAIGIIDEAIKNLGYDDKVKIRINIDASSFFDMESGYYNLSFKHSDRKEDYGNKPKELQEKYLALLTQYPNIISIEDPFSLDDRDNWSLVYHQPNLQIVCREAAPMKYWMVQDLIDNGEVANCVDIEPWRASTITEANTIAMLAKHPSLDINVNTGYGYCEDLFLADYAVGLSAGIFKAGAPIKTAYYNQLIRIEQELGSLSDYAGNRLICTLMY